VNPTRLLPIVVLVAAAVLAGCAPTPTVRQFDKLEYATPLGEFQRWWVGEQAAAQGVATATIWRWWRDQPRRLDALAARTRPWDVSTDMCSFSPDTGPTFDFRAACVRHDFAWRNLKRLQALWGGRINTRSNRVRATDQFLRDMRLDCDRRARVARTSCRAAAAFYHQVVLLVS
jgi:hypothetical protein